MYTHVRRAPTAELEEAELEESSPQPGKLLVGAADDRYEVAADRAAAEVVARLSQPAAAGSSAPVSRSAGSSPLTAPVQRSAAAPASNAVVGAEGGGLPASVESQIESARSSGSALDPATRAAMEAAFGADFSAVRTHSGSQSSALNDALQAKAFTVGSDIFFNGRVPDAGGAAGQQLLAHELAHTLQHDGGDSSIQRWSFGKDDKPKKQDPQAIAKKKEVTEKKRLDGERELGNQQRTALKEKVGDDPSVLGDVTGRFNTALADEAKLRESLIASGTEPEEAETEAYQQIWMKADPELRALRPMRETRAEKLISKTGETRTEMAVAASAKKNEANDKGGSLVSRKVEDLMVAELTEVERLVIEGEPRSRAEKMAHARIWSKADKKVVAKAPAVGSKLEAAAYEIAAKRVGRVATKPEGSNSDILKQGVTAAKVTMGVTSKIGTGVKMGFNDGDKTKLSQGEMGGGGVESISNMVTGVLDSIIGIRDFVALISQLTSQTSLDYNDIGGAIKAGLDQVGQLNKNVSSAMKIAGALSESSLSAVASMIPIVDVIGNAIAIASGIAESVPNAMRLGSTVGDIYLARGADRPELVLLLQRLGRRNGQLLEQSLYSTSSAVVKLTLGIAQLASGGADFGATTGLKTAVLVIDAAHSFGHFVADEVFAVQAKGARKQLVGKSEGSAEQVLSKDASYAIDALLTAATKGDKATQALARGALRDGYGVKFTTGGTDEIAAAHDRILKILKESDQPKTTLDKLKDGVNTIKSKAGAMSDKAADVSTLASARTTVDGKKRGFGWRMKMWFKSDAALARRIAAHNVEQGDDRMTVKGHKGGVEDPNITSPKLQESLIKEMKAMSTPDLQKAMNDMKRSQFERIVFAQAFAERLKDDLGNDSGEGSE